MTSVATAAERQVANTTPSTGIPACARICGFTTTMYAMVRKVVRPPSISCLHSGLVLGQPEIAFDQSLSSKF